MQVWRGGRLAGVSFGRIVFTEHALPAIRPINHIVDGGAVIVRARLGAGPRNGNRGITSDFIRIDAELVTGYELAE